MRRAFARWSVAAVIAAACAAAGAAAPRSSDAFAAGAGEIDRYVERIMERDRIPGVAVVVADKEGVLFARGYGNDGRGGAVDERTGFVLGSMSKSFTAMAVLRAAEAGLLGLDDPLRLHLPWFRLADGSGGGITLRHLLHHTSGIPAEAPRAHGARVGIDDHVRALARVRPRGAPGMRFEYASPNYLALAAALEAATGLSYGDYLEAELFGPAGMELSAASRGPEVESRLASGHRYWFGFPAAAAPLADPGREPTAGIVAGAGDLGRYMAMILNGGEIEGRRILTRAGIETLTRGVAGAEGDSERYAMGWREELVDGRRRVHHGGVLPEYRGKMVLLPDSGLGVAVLTNVSTTLPLPLLPSSHRMADDLAGFLEGAPLSPPRVSLSWLYAGLWLAAAAVLFGQISAVFKAEARAARLRRRSRGGRLLRLAGEFAWPAALPLILPSLTRVGWPELARGAPDLALWTAALCLAGLGSATALALALARRDREGGAA